MATYLKDKAEGNGEREVRTGAVHWFTSSPLKTSKTYENSKHYLVNVARSQGLKLTKRFVRCNVFFNLLTPFILKMLRRLLDMKTDVKKAFKEGEK